LTREQLTIRLLAKKDRCRAGWACARRVRAMNGLRQADREALMADLRMSWRRGDVGGARIRLLAAGIPSWLDKYGRVCISLMSAAGLLAMNRSSVLQAVRAGRLPATPGIKEHRQYRGQRPWLIPVQHILAYQVNEAMRTMGRRGGLQTADRLRILRSLFRNEDCPENGRSVMD